MNQQQFWTLCLDKYFFVNNMFPSLVPGAAAAVWRAVPGGSDGGRGSVCGTGPR